MENMKRVVSLMLCIVMVFGLLPMTVFATDVDTTDEFFEEYFEEEVEVEAAVVGNENPVNPEDIIYEEEIIEETAPVVENEDPVAPVAEGGYAPVTQSGTKGDANTYVQATSIKDGQSYLVVAVSNSISNSTYYAMSNNSGSLGNTTDVTVNNGTLTLDNGVTASNLLWKFESVNGGYNLSNNGKYLYGSKYGNSYSLSLSDTATAWTYADNHLSASISGSTRYVRYNSGWKLNRNNTDGGTEIRLYEVSSVSGTYSIEAEDLSVTATAGRTVELKNVNLVFTPDSGEATATDVTKTATYNVVEGEDIVSVANGVATFTGKEGKAVVKVSYKTDFGIVVNYFTVTAKTPGYSLDIYSGEQNVTGTVVSVKKVTAATTMQLTAKAVLTDDNGAVVSTETVTPVWEIPTEYKKIATIDATGKISFKGIDGEFYVTATWVDGNGKSHTARVDISATTTSYTVPSDNTTDFPEYPNEGAIRYDKTAVAVGNFAETGIAKMELSMTGVPYHTGSEIDVVIMLDRSSSMYKEGVKHRISSTIAATKTFVESIVKNADGSFNGNRILVLDFLGGNLDTKEGGGSDHKFQCNQYTSNESNGYQVINDQVDTCVEEVLKIIADKAD